MQGTGFGGGLVGLKWRSGWVCCALVCAGPALALVGCGDDARESASEGMSASATEASATQSTVTTPTTGSASEGVTGTGEAGSMSASMTDASATLPTTSRDRHRRDRHDRHDRHDDRATPMARWAFAATTRPRALSGPSTPTARPSRRSAPSTPVLEWSNKQAGSTRQTYNQVMMTPIVATITDDDADGVYGSDGDMPSVLFIDLRGCVLGSARACCGRSRATASKELLTISNQNIAASRASRSATSTATTSRRSLPCSTSARSVVALGHDGALKWTSAAYPGDIRL
jgi:hypothetical protein